MIDYTRFDMELASYMNKNLDMFVLVVEKVAYEQIMANNKKLPLRNIWIGADCLNPG